MEAIIQFGWAMLACTAVFMVGMTICVCWAKSMETDK